MAYTVYGDKAFRSGNCIGGNMWISMRYLLLAFLVAHSHSSFAQSSANSCISIQQPDSGGYFKLKNGCSDEWVYVACWHNKSRVVCTEPKMLEPGQTIGYAGAEREAWVRSCRYIRS